VGEEGSEQCWGATRTVPKTLSHWERSGDCCMRSNPTLQKECFVLRAGKTKKTQHQIGLPICKTNQITNANLVNLYQDKTKDNDMNYDKKKYKIWDWKSPVVLPLDN